MLYAMPARGSGSVFEVRTVIAIQAKTDIELEIAHRDGILPIERVLVHIGSSMEVEEAFRPRVRSNGRMPGANGGRRNWDCRWCSVCNPAAAHWPGSVRVGSPTEFPIGINTGGVKSRIGDAETKVLKQPGLLQVDAVLQVVAAVRWWRYLP